MNTRRIVSAVAVVIVAVGASFLLMQALSSTQIAGAASVDVVEGLSISPEVAVPPADGPVAAQALSVTFPSHGEPSYARSEISVDPEPPIAGHPTELCAEVVNHDPVHPHTALLEFGVAEFGIGVPFVPVGATEVHVPPGGGARGCVVWVPPTPRRWCIQARLIVNGFHEISQRNIDVWESLVPAQTDELAFAVGPFLETTTISFETKHILPGWVVQVEPLSLTLDADQPGMATLKVTPQAGLLGSREIVADVEGYVNGELVGGFRKLDMPPVPLHRLRDPFYAESEIHVWPYPPRAGEPTEICVELVNLSGETRTVEVQFSWANFGIGLPFTPINGPIVREIPPYGRDVVCIQWVPPFGGHFCVQTRLELRGGDAYHPQFSQRNLDVAEPLVPGQGHASELLIGNHFNEFTNPAPAPRTIFLTKTVHLPGWEVELIPAVLNDLPEFTEQWVTMIVTPPLEKPLPPDNTPIVDVWAYYEEGLEKHVIGGFRKLYRPPVPLHPFPDPPYAEREISVHPYPPRAGEPTEICVELRNPTDQPQVVTVHFAWAHFGIGLPFQPINGPRVVHLPPHSVVNECIHWIPPVGGHVCLEVALEMEGYEPQRSQRNIDIDEPLEQGVPHLRHFPVGNPYDHPVTITLGLIPHVPDDWVLDLSPDVLTNVLPGPEGVREVILTVKPPPDRPLPRDMVPIVDVEAFAGEHLIGGFRKVHRPPVPLHPFPDPPYAEREISVHPYPPRAGEPTEICVELRNPTPFPQDVVVHFAWANFGIGLPFRPINGPRPVHLPPYSIVRECIHWIPPVGGHVCLEVVLEMEGYEPQRSQRNIDVDEPLEPGIPHSRPFPVGNPYDHPVTITLGLISHVPDDWGLELSQEVLTNVLPGPQGVRKVILTVTPTLDLPSDEHPIVDVEGFVEGELIGGFRKVYRPPVPIHRPRDPIYAESEIFVHPYPPRAREPTEVGVEIRNPTDVSQTVTVTFSYANFGIGLPFMSINGPITVTVPAHGIVHPSIIWLPLDGGLWCIQVEIELPDLDEVFYSQRNIDVGEPLEPNVPHSRPFLVGNPTSDTVTITLGLISHVPDDWEIELSQDVLTNVLPGPQGVREVILTVTPPDDLPKDGHPIVDIEGYIEGELIGGFRKVFHPPVPIHRPNDPVYAESEIGVDPYPVLPGQPTELSVEVFNPTDKDRIVTVTFSIARFGIGLPFTTTNIAPNPIRVFVPAHGAARGHVIWHPPWWRGKFCVQVTLEIEGHEPVWSRRNIDVGEPLRPGRPHAMEFPVGGWPFTKTVTVTLGLVDHKDGWVTSLSTDTVTVDRGQRVSVTLTVTPPLNIDLGSDEPIVDVEGYVEGELIGGFRKIDRPPVPLHKPHEKGYAESEIIIDPYPPAIGKDTWVGTVVQNNGNVPLTVTLEFGWAKFGMGIPFTTTGMDPYTRTVVVVPAYLTRTTGVTWTPSMSGPQCVIIRLRDVEEIFDLQVSQRNVNVVERPPCGHTKEFTFTVHNHTGMVATVDLGLITFDVPADWVVTTTPSQTLTLDPGEEGVVTVTVKIGCAPTLQAMGIARQMYALQAQAGSVPTIDVEGYIDGDLVGGIELQFSGEATYEIYLPAVHRQYP